MRLQVLNEKRFVYVEQVTAEDAGSYRCFAENVAGKAEKTFEVSVVVKPHIEGAHVVTEVEARVSHTAHLHCPVADGRNVQVTWTKDGVPLSELELSSGYQIAGSGKELVIPRLDMENAGTYSCVAKNAAGETRKDFDLKVLSKSMTTK